MHFRVLGAMSSDLRLPSRHRGGRVAKILGALLLSANQPVSMDALVDMLWGTAAPATARQQVQNCASTLDRTLRAGELPAVQRMPRGYLLEVAAEQLDMLMFEHDAAAGQAALAMRDHATASRILRRGLDLWRGDVLQGIELGPFESIAVRLRQLRVATLESYFECELEQGRPSAVLGELSAAVHTHPTQERLVAQLMRALAARGRTVEALEVFHRTATFLADDYGMDPGPDLAAEYVGLLRQTQRIPQSPEPRAVRADVSARTTQRLRTALSTLDALRNELESILRSPGAVQERVAPAPARADLTRGSSRR